MILSKKFNCQQLLLLFIGFTFIGKEGIEYSGFCMKSLILMKVRRKAWYSFVIHEGLKN